MVGDTMFSVSILVVVAFFGGALLMLLSDTAVDLWNRLYADGVDDVPVYSSQRPGTEWQPEAGSTSPGGPARCPLCLETQPPVDVFFVRQHGQLVCRPCSRLSPVEAARLRSHQ